MKTKRWQNLALGLAFAIPVIGVYIGKKLISKKAEKPAEIHPEVTRIRVPLSSLIGIQHAEIKQQAQNTSIILPEDAAQPEFDEDKSLSSEIPQYIASVDRGIFHLPTCRWAQNIKAENRLIIEDRASAIDRGLSPCNTCNP